jgi:cell division protein FtsB
LTSELKEQFTKKVTVNREDFSGLKAILEAASQKLFQWRRRGATLALCLVAVWVAYHVIFGANGTMVYSHKLAEHHALDQEIIQLKQENEHLARHVDALKNDSKTIEKEAREQLRYARPGEVIYTLPQPMSGPSTVTAEKH